MQILISESMKNLAVAKNDLRFQQLQRLKYEQSLQRIIEVREMALKYDDTDYLSHIEQLSKNHLKLTEWKLEPLENP